MNPFYIKGRTSPPIPIPQPVKNQVSTARDYLVEHSVNPFISPVADITIGGKKSFRDLIIDSNESAFVSMCDALLSYGEQYHGLGAEEIKTLVYKVIATLSNHSRNGEAFEEVPHESINSGTDIYYSLDQHTAYLIFKTNRHEGTHREGCNAAKIIWHKPKREDLSKPRKTIIPVIDKLYFLISKAGSKLAHNEPYQMQIARRLPEVEKKPFAALVLQCEFFVKQHKEFDDRSIGFYPFCPSTLKESLKTHPKLALCYLHDALRALEFLHKYGIVHGDFTWNNLLVTEDQRVVLADFDFSFIQKEEKPRWSSIFYGTHHYTAPELLQETATDYRKTDIWAWGVLAYAVGYGIRPAYTTYLIDSKSTNNPELLQSALQLQLDMTASRTQAYAQLERAQDDLERARHISVFALQENPEKRYSATDILEVMNDTCPVSQFDRMRQEQIAEDKQQELIESLFGEKDKERKRK